MGHSDSQSAGPEINVGPAVTAEEGAVVLKAAQVGMDTLHWNRGLAKPLINVGAELGVVAKVLEFAKAVSEADVPKSADGNFNTGNQDLDLLLGLTEDMAEGRGNMDVGILWSNVMKRIVADLNVAAGTPAPAQQARSVDRFLTDNLRLWKESGIPAPANELQSIQAWLRHLGEHGQPATAQAMRARMALLMKASISLHQAGPEAEDAAGIFDNRSREQMKAPAPAAAAAAKEPCFYVASRASDPARAKMWVRLRDVEGYRINATWIDAVVNETPVAYEELWPKICEEVSRCDCLVLYVEPQDFPLRGAFVEVGMALAAGKPVRVVAPGVPLAAEDFKPLGSWAKHPLVSIVSTLERAFQNVPQH